jgi:hypothetical protein
MHPCHTTCESAQYLNNHREIFITAQLTQSMWGGLSIICTAHVPDTQSICVSRNCLRKADRTLPNLSRSVIVEVTGQSGFIAVLYFSSPQRVSLFRLTGSAFLVIAPRLQDDLLCHFVIYKSPDNYRLVVLYRLDTHPIPLSNSFSASKLI